MENVIDIRHLLLENYWTWAGMEGEIYDAEFLSMELAYKSAEDCFGEACERDGTPGSYEADIKLIRFSRCPDTLDMLIWEVKADIVEFTFYQGDAREHGYP